ncbi:hypothetical protein [Spiroplasma eriocheiris]|uniref:Uncharacterized protein n=1 Tax=Spiroplasma eriocheiris TaxID=315358 RepID=A0A0H3XLA5_9MOLU|nr:hypothetical protein [Spiroplasma eriocheiris]AHF58269.1 hypothetical protein SPE_1157 [Spiroplasma eriocheiris CCTCC M 207170]AKM54706.1 hypothetical protein SERIO_v1c11550 [Spiroplasma eriocheiris]
MAIDKKINYYFGSIIFIAILDAALTISIFTRAIISLIHGQWIPPVIQIIPLIFFGTLLYFEVSFLCKYYQEKKKHSHSSFQNTTALLAIQTKNPQRFKIKIIFNYIACGFVVLMGFIGIIPLCLMIKGQQAYQKSVQENINNKKM